MSDPIEIWEKPEAEEIYMLAGWRQWADAGSISSMLPQYLIQQTQAEHIGSIRSDDFYLFQIPATHDLVRPVVKFKDGFPESLDVPVNELYYTGDGRRGMVFFLGDEPHLHIEHYAAAFLDTAEQLGVRRIVGLGGVYGELPYDKERTISAIYSRPQLQAELDELAVNLSNYHGGASIGSYICRRAAEREMEYVSFYAFVPTYDFSQVSAQGNAIRLENDFTAWLGVMRRINHMLKLDFDLGDLEARSAKLITVIEEKVDELDREAPQLGVREYLARLSNEFVEVPFMPLDDVWEEELRHLLDDLDPE